MPGTWSSPSGSRWEPTPGVGANTTVAAAATSGTVDREDAVRRRRSPLLVVVVALLSIGGVGAGAYAYERATGDATPAATAASGTDGQPGDAGRVPGQGHGDGDHHRGGVDDQGPGTDGDR